MSEPTQAELLAQLAAVQAQMAKLQQQLTAQQAEGVTAGEGGVAVGSDLDNNTITTGDRNVIGDSNSVINIRTLYLQAPGRAALDQAAFDQALDRYLAWIINRYGHLGLRGIERREQQVLSLTLDDVYVLLRSRHACAVVRR